MPEILFLEERPSQRFPFRIGDDEYTFLFMYNQLADRWSYSIFPPEEDCPVIAGRFLDYGDDLISELNLPYYLMVADKAGVPRGTFNWYERLTVPIGNDERPASYLVFMSAEEALEIFSQPETVPFPVC